MTKFEEILQLKIRPKEKQTNPVEFERISSPHIFRRKIEVLLKQV